MWILPLVGYLGLAIGFSFLTLAIASGLYYLSELVEEHTVIAKRFLTRMIYAIIGTQVLLCIIDGFPFKLSVMSIVSHLIYLLNLRRFPFVKLSEPLFIISCVLVIINHYFWFSHFSNVTLNAPQSRYDPPNLPTFTEIASYFGLLVWLVPFSLFVSLSASDNVLPTMGSEAPGMPGAPKEKPQGLFKVMIEAVREWITIGGRAAGLWRDDRVGGF